MTEDYTTIREETQRMIDGHENKDYDYKESPGGVDPADLVAFANSNGGSILIGVADRQDASGRQYGEIVGCNQSFDDVRNAIHSKARNCIPPLEIIVSREFNGSDYIFRIDISEVQEKPCCTNGGRYTIRESGSRRGLSPSQVKSIIMEREYQEFVERLQEAGSQFVTVLTRGQENLASKITLIQDIAEKAKLAAESAEDAADEAKQAAEQATTAAEEAREAAMTAADAAENIEY